jgi:hypothetical protein
MGCGAMAKKTFWVSLCYRGAHGGGLYLTEDNLKFRTNKLQLPENMKSINIQYDDIKDIFPCRSLAIFPAISIRLRNGSNYKFIVFSREKILKHINGKLNPVA